MTSSTDDRRSARSSARGTSKGTCFSASVRLARTMRWETVDSDTRKARAISSVVRPPSKRSVSATRASVDSTGWQEMNTRPQQVVADVVVERGVGIRRGELAARSRGRARAPRACAPPASGGAAGRLPDSSQWPSARRPAWPGRPSPASARARSPGRPARAPRRRRRRAPCARDRRSDAATRCARPPRWRDGCRKPSRLPSRASSPARARPARREPPHCSQQGPISRTSTVDHSAAGHRSASAIASSRVLQSR